MAASGVLPTYQRYVNGVPVPSSRKTLRLREKYIILLVFATFGIVCFGAFFFLPNLQDRVTMVEVRKRFRDAGEGLFLPQQEGGGTGNAGKVIPFRHDDFVDPHKIDDKIRLQMNIEKDWENVKVKEALDKQGIKEDQAKQIKGNIQEDKEKILMKQKEEEEKKKEEERKKALEVDKDHAGHPGAQGGEPLDSSVKEKRDKVREVRTKILRTKLHLPVHYVLLHYCKFIYYVLSAYNYVCYQLIKQHTCSMV